MSSRPGGRPNPWAEPTRFGVPGEVERRLGWVLTLVGLLQLAATTGTAVRTAPQHPLWWNLGGVVVVALVLLLAVFGLVMPMRVIVAVWTAVPTGLAVLGLAAFAPRDGVVPTDGNPWPWAMGPLAYGYLAVVVSRPVRAFLGPVLLSLFPAVSALFFLGEIPRELAALVPVHLAGFFYTVIFLLLRRRLLRLHVAERRARAAEEQRVRVEVELRRRDELSRLVHDNVLAVLNAAIALQGGPSAALRSEAGAALDLLEPAERAADPGERTDDVEVAAATLARRLDAAWRRIDPGCTIAIDADPGAVPPAVAVAVEDASCEALRNSLYHAGARATRTVTARLSGESVEVWVCDDGLGFDPAAVPEVCLGIRGSIRGRIRDMGGEAVVASRVGEGTTVSMRWHG